MRLCNYFCEQVNKPLCKTLGIEPTTYDSFNYKFYKLQINSPYTLALLIISILCTFRMISHVNSLYSSIGRGEMKTFFGLYIISNFFLTLTLCFEKSFKKELFNFINILQVSFHSTMYFSLFATGLTIDKIYGIFGLRSVTFMQILCSIYFFIIFIFSYIFATLKLQELVTVLLFIDIAPVILYLAVQISKLKKNREDIWGLGVLGVIFIFFSLSIVHSVVGASLVAGLSERNIDNYFLSIAYTFLVVMMSHKFWLSTYDFEQECLALKV